MQQTEKYKLNLIESSDPFLPEGLNQNTQKVENAMIDHEAAVDEKIAAVVSRVVELEKFHFISGTYIGDGVAGRVLQLGFTPAALFLWSHNPQRLLIFVNGLRYSPGYAEIVSGGFKLTETDFNSHNALSHYYAYAALGLDE